MQDIVVMGSSISGNLAACYLKQTLPDLRVVVVGRVDARRPIVGESTISVTTRFLHRIGLGRLLVERHLPKYALTYYYKEHLDRPDDATYRVSESPFVLPELSYNLNRFTFDQDLRRHNEALGVVYVDGTVKGVELGSAAPGIGHRITVRTAAGEEVVLTGRWLIDATGRNRFLARKLGLQAKPPPFIAQRSAFWFRLADFDRGILARVDAIKKENTTYDPYYVTHHFLGKGNWIWAIPMRSEGPGDLISIGLCYREDLYGQAVSSIEQFTAAVRREHPVLADLVASGRVVDHNSYRNYMYDSRQIYSDERWYIIGDAAHAVDPLYSTGLANTTIQIEQVAEMIRRDHEGASSTDFVRSMERAFKALYYGAQGDISALYEVMHDSFQCHLRMHFVTASVFAILVPFVSNGYFSDPVGSRLFSHLMASDGPVARDNAMLYELIELAARSAKGISAADYVEVQDAFTFNIPYLEHSRDEDIPASMARLMRHLCRHRLRLLRKLGWRELLARPAHLLAPLRNAASAWVLDTAFRGKSLRRSPIIGKLVSGSSAPPEARPAARAVAAHPTAA